MSNFFMIFLNLKHQKITNIYIVKSNFVFFHFFTLSCKRIEKQRSVGTNDITLRTSFSVF